MKTYYKLCIYKTTIPKMNQLTENISYCGQNIMLRSFRRAGLGRLIWHKTGDDAMLLLEEFVQNVKAGDNALGHSSTNHNIGTNCVLDNAHISNSTPLYCQACIKKKDMVRDI